MENFINNDNSENDRTSAYLSFSSQKHVMKSISSELSTRLKNVIFHLIRMLNSAFNGDESSRRTY